MLIILKSMSGDIRRAKIARALYPLTNPLAYQSPINGLWQGVMAKTWRIKMEPSFTE
ncbi:hypothetical protein SAMN04488490_1718 [Marinobacter sp. LV10R510-11A]|nr:hypothetical protein SAMN04488490_1718 [Marinobacter sp. LV10R510-11A]